MTTSSSKPVSEPVVVNTVSNPLTSTVPAAGGAVVAAATAPSTLSDYQTISRVAGHLDSDSRQALAACSKNHADTIYQDPLDSSVKDKKITSKLLIAVANGMESRAVNVAPKKNDLYAEDLLRRSPEFLLKKGDLTDWGGRTFKNIMLARIMRLILMLVTGSSAMLAG